MQIESFLSHQKTKSHVHACQTFRGVSPDDECAGAPDKELVSAVLEWRKTPGVALASCHLECGRFKLRQIIFCLAEAIRDHDRKQLQNAACIALQQDARGSRLMVRFAAVVAGSFERVVGVLGQAKGFGSTHVEIARATEKNMQRFCTPFYGAPLTPGKACPATFNQDLWTHLRNSVEMLGSDAAADEQLALRLLRTSSASANKPLFPNLRLILRDRTHAARRTALCFFALMGKAAG